MVLISDKLDSIDRSFTRQGFSITTGNRDQRGYFDDTIRLQSNSRIILRMPFSENIENIYDQLNEWGAHISEITFELNDLSPIITLCDNADIPYDYEDEGLIRLIPDAEPLAIYIEQSSEHLFGDTIHHPNNVYRIDWMLLSASDDVRKMLSLIFDLCSNGKYQISKYDLWRMGSDQYPSFIRFEPARLIPSKPENFLSLEAPNLYFAY